MLLRSSLSAHHGRRALLAPTASALLLGVTMLASTGCSDSAADTASGGAASGGGQTGGTNAGGNGGQSFGDGGSGGNTTSNLGGGDVCAAEEFFGEQVNVDLYIMLDQSGSMNEPAGATTRWEAVTDAIAAFMQQVSAADDLGVGLQYFPLFATPPIICNGNPDCPANQVCVTGYCLPEPAYQCEASAHATPEVEIATLPGNEAAILASLSAHDPFGGTSTAPALAGAIDHARAWTEAHPGRRAVAVLATDGLPTECDPTDIPGIAAIAAAGVSGSPSVLTFVIGVGDTTSLANLNAIAVAGGTTAAFLVEDADATQEFIDALNTIGGSLDCEFLIPQPARGEELDFGKVNVRYTPQGGEPTLIPQVPGAADCAANDGGWYYDDPLNPTKIEICPSTCAMFQNVAGSVDILLGCVTVVPS